MKLAVTGKGGVGKTLLSALLVKVLEKRGAGVFAIDADPDANLASALGFENPSGITPLVRLKEVIEERTGAKPGSYSSYFKINPRVDDIPEKFFARKGRVRLGVMGSVRGGGLGCVCPESAFLKALLSHIILEKSESVVLDMEAGIEHLGRGTVASASALAVVVEPGSRSVETAFRIRELARDIGLGRMLVVGNKVRGGADEDFIRKSLAGFEFAGFIPFSAGIIEADLSGRPFYETCPEVIAEGGRILDAFAGSEETAEKEADNGG